MKIQLFRFFSFALLGSFALIASVFAGGEAGQLVLRDIGYRFIGHTTVQKDDGSLDVLNSMYVHYLLPAIKQHKYPVVMIHGGASQGTDWLETPDGRDGWAEYFVADGWDVYVVDRPSHGRSQSNPTCSIDIIPNEGFSNTGIISMLATADEDVWPGGEPTATNDAVVSWSAGLSQANYCGDEIAAETISVLLDEIGPAILFSHGGGGGSSVLVPDINPDKVVGLIAYEVLGWNPVLPLIGSPSPIEHWEVEPPLAVDFTPTEVHDCPMQGNSPSQAVNYAGIPVVLAAGERGMGVTADDLDCLVAVWQQAGVDATSLYFPDIGLNGSGHFAMGQLDNAEYAQVFMNIAAELESSSGK